MEIVLGEFYLMGLEKRKQNLEKHLEIFLQLNLTYSINLIKS